MLRNLIAIFLTLVFVSACQTKPVDTAGAGAGGTAGMDGTVTPGTQADLEANVGDRIWFEFDSSSLNAEAQATLTRQANWLSANPSITLTVEGHCDERGTREYNLALGERRANVVKNFLTNAGVEASRLSTISYGKERPAVVGADEEAWRQNRRGVSVVNQ
jgi:peptidoglycan-associated lipoprotein